MALKFKNGDKVRQVLPAPIEGTVASFRFDESSGEVSFLVERIDEDGTIHQNVFSEDQLEVVPIELVPIELAADMPTE